MLRHISWYLVLPCLWPVCGLLKRELVLLVISPVIRTHPIAWHTVRAQLYLLERRQEGKGREEGKEERTVVLSRVLDFSVGSRPGIANNCWVTLSRVYNLFQPKFPYLSMK